MLQMWVWEHGHEHEQEHKQEHKSNKFEKVREWKCISKYTEKKLITEFIFAGHFMILEKTFLQKVKYWGEIELDF